MRCDVMTRNASKSGEPLCAITHIYEDGSHPGIDVEPGCEQFYIDRSICWMYWTPNVNRSIFCIYTLHSHAVLMEKEWKRTCVGLTVVESPEPLYSES